MWVDPRREHIAVKEAQRMGIPTVALIDTDSDPDPVDLPIPGNDDSIRSIEVIVAKLADAVLEGRAALPADQSAGNRNRPQPNRDGRDGRPSLLNEDTVVHRVLVERQPPRSRG